MHKLPKERKLTVPVKTLKEATSCRGYMPAEGEYKECTK